MTVATTRPNPRRIARLTGAAYLGIIVTGIFAEFFVRMSLVKDGDAAMTSTNIASSVSLFRAGIVADLAMIALDICVAIGLYELLRHVHRPLALLAAAFRLVQASVLGANLMNLSHALGWATLSTAEGGLDRESTQALVLSSMELHGVGYDLGLVFFGLSCLVLGHLMRVSKLVPMALGIGLSLTGCVYLVGSLCVILAPEIAASLDPMYGFTLMVELSVAGWLLVKGVQLPRWAQTPMIAAATLLFAACGTAPTAGSEEGRTTPGDTEPTNTTDTDPGASAALDNELVSGSYIELGRHDVGYRQLQWEDASGGKTLVKAWYPAMKHDDDDAISYEIELKLPGFPVESPALVLGHALLDANVKSEASI